ANLFNCVHTDGRHARCATALYSKNLLCVRLLRGAVAEAVGHRACCSGLDPSCRRWWSGRSATPPPPPRCTPRTCTAHLTHPVHRPRRQIGQFPLPRPRRCARLRPASSIHPPLLCSPALICGWQLAGGAGEIVLRSEPCRFVPAWIGLVCMGRDRVGIRSVWVRGR
ncbi:hypothetical protein EJB05_18273, partial [Eragrostis curvula]